MTPQTSATYRKWWPGHTACWQRAPTTDAGANCRNHPWKGPPTTQRMSQDLPPSPRAHKGSCRTTLTEEDVVPPGHLAPECTCAPVATTVKVSKTAVHPSTGQQWKQKIRILLTFLNTAALLLVAADTGVVLTSVVRGAERWWEWPGQGPQMPMARPLSSLSS